MEWKGGMKHYFESIFDSLLQSKVIEPFGLIMLDPKVNNSIEEKNIIKRYNYKVKVIYRSVGYISRRIETLFTRNIDRQKIYYVKSLKVDTVHVLWDNGYVNNITEKKDMPL